MTTSARHPPGPGDWSDDDWGREQRRLQMIRGLELTPAERLRWLEETMALLRSWQGRAREDRPAGPEPE